SLCDERVSELAIRGSLVRSRRRGRVVPASRTGSARMEILGTRERLTDERTADHSTIHGHERSVRLPVEQHLREASDDAGVDEARDETQHERHRDGWPELFAKHGFSLCVILSGAKDLLSRREADPSSLGASG